MPSTASPKLSEDTIDDIIYFARANEPDDLLATLYDAAKATGTSPHEILAAAVEERSGSTALHMAAANGHTDLLARLLALLPLSLTPDASNLAPAADAAPLSPSSPAGVINAPNAAGNTALHWAALNGHLDAVRSLVGAGADLEARNKAGRDAVFEAEGAGKEEVVSYLLGVGAEREAVGKEAEKGEGAEGEGEGEGEDVEVKISVGDTGEVDGVGDGGKSLEEGVGKLGVGEKD